MRAIILGSVYAAITRFRAARRRRSIGDVTCKHTRLEAELPGSGKHKGIGEGWKLLVGVECTGWVWSGRVAGNTCLGNGGGGRCVTAAGCLQTAFYNLNWEIATRWGFRGCGLRYLGGGPAPHLQLYPFLHFILILQDKL